MARHWPADPKHDELIQKLKREVSEVRDAILGMMQGEVEKRLTGFYSCKTRQELQEWKQGVVDFVVGLAEPIPGTRVPEAKCPLCESCGHGPYMRGYKVPEGLELHLRGASNARARLCPVTNAAWDLAREVLSPKFEEEDNRRKEHLASRRKVETVFLTDPLDSPRLIDENPYRQPRDDESLAWAEARLRDLGFDVSVLGNVKTYKLEKPEYVVYADPRSRGAIECVVYEQPLRPKRRSRISATFEIADGWKEELENKFARSLLDAVQRLSTWRARVARVSRKRKGTHGAPAAL
jgi:hypothetical protein